MAHLLCLGFERLQLLMWSLPSTASAYFSILVCEWTGVPTWFLGADFSALVCEGVWVGDAEAAVDLACLSLLILPAREVPICVLMIYTMYSVYVQSPEKIHTHKNSHRHVNMLNMQSLSLTEFFAMRSKIPQCHPPPHCVSVSRPVILLSF